MCNLVKYKLQSLTFFLGGGGNFQSLTCGTLSLSLSQKKRKKKKNLNTLVLTKRKKEFKHSLAEHTHCGTITKARPLNL